MDTLDTKELIAFAALVFSTIVIVAISYYVEERSKRRW